MKITDKSIVSELLKAIEYIENNTIVIGVLGEQDTEVVKYATYNEFGVMFKIPERSFIRAGFDANKNKFIERGNRLIEDVITLKLKPHTFLEIMGEYLAGIIKDYLVDLRSPPNSQQTIEQKGSSNPLVDTGRLRDSITYKIESR